MFGLEEAIRSETAGVTSQLERQRIVRKLELAQQMMLSVPTPEDLAFLHSGLCQTYLPHSRPRSNQQVWRRAAGRFTLMVQPGVMQERGSGNRALPPANLAEQERLFVGVPFGAKARLILIYLQTEAVRTQKPVIHLGRTISAFMRTLDLPVKAEKISMVREQALRLSRCTFTLQWDGEVNGTQVRTLRDIRMVEGLDMVAQADGRLFPEAVTLHPTFFEDLRDHAAPLDRRALKSLSASSLGLDLYALFAYRLPRLSAPLHLSWSQLSDQLGAAESATKELARRIRDELPDVLAAYPDARVEATRRGLQLAPSPPAVPRNAIVNGFRLMPRAKG
jgi:hypothetical protein